jgi:hypothetical protein
VIHGAQNASALRASGPIGSGYTAAHRWLAASGSESGLMAVAGWSRADMLVRYDRARV